MVLEEVTSDSVEGFDEPYSDSEVLSDTDPEEEWDISPEVRFFSKSQWSILGQLWLQYKRWLYCITEVYLSITLDNKVAFTWR